MEGRIHSLESFGTVDGPGVRFVVFTQGCPLRCAYCHNPDTWPFSGGMMMEPAEIIKKYERNINFYTEGGLTVTGGEPLMQIDFLIELFTLAKKKKIHTCIDSSGIAHRPDDEAWLTKLETLLKLTDLVMLDIKHINKEKHIHLTSLPNDNILAFARFLDKHHVDTWIRHVVVPGVTDEEKYLYELGYFVGELSNITALDILPYHTMGVVKYESMNMEYSLKDTPAMEKSEAVEKKAIVLQGIKDKHKELGIS